MKKNDSKMMFVITLLMMLWMIAFVCSIIWFPRPEWPNIMKYAKLYSLQASAATVIPFYLFFRGIGVAVNSITKDRVTPSLTTLFILSGIFWICNAILLFIYLTHYINILTDWYHIVVFGLFVFCFVLFHIIASILDRILRKKQNQSTPFSIAAVYVLFWVLLIMTALLLP